MYEEWGRDYGINGKVYANIFIDDRGGLMENFQILETAYHIVRQTRML
jgi:hypothetical protein